MFNINMLEKGKENGLYFSLQTLNDLTFLKKICWIPKKENEKRKIIKNMTLSITLSKKDLVKKIAYMS